MKVSTPVHFSIGVIAMMLDLDVVVGSEYSEAQVPLCAREKRSMCVKRGEILTLDFLS
jgi:hypothetical protein